MRWVGIDPGSRTGLVCLELAAGTTDVARARWIGSARLAPSSSVKLSVAEQKATLFDRVRAQLTTWSADAVVLEEPIDAAAFWAASGRGIQGQSRGTLFALGEHYGLCLAAAKACPSAAAIASYPCGNHRGRPGWMAAGNRKIPRAHTLQALGLLARSLRADDLSEDELMALGVLRFHLQRTLSPSPLAARASDPTLSKATR